MESLPETQQTLNELRSRDNNSSILSIVAPLFETVQYNDAYSPQRISQHKEGLQLLWQIGERQSDNYEQICLTLSRKTLSLTVALDHRHNLSVSEVPVLPRSTLEIPSRSTIIINPQAQMLSETHRFNSVLLGTFYNEEAIARFTPELTHSLAVIGLYGYGQETEREVS
jgi:hypothetical protein